MIHAIRFFSAVRTTLISRNARIHLERLHFPPPVIVLIHTKIAQAQWGSQPESTMFAPQGLQSILKEGGQHFAGVDEAIVKNIEACKKIGEITQTSMGPNGMNKLLVDHLDKHIVTSDTAKMLQTLEVMHPAAKLLAEGQINCGASCVPISSRLLNQLQPAMSHQDRWCNQLAT